ncbi:MAG TPA: nucleotide exchange factor GrpE [Candidatus Acidoferrum sp.]|nr:nucleotide exchange factor GrpE [Candidatus Acidoferrum sp.]
MLDKDFNIDRDESDGLDETPEAKSVAADSAVADAEIARLAADLQDLRQTLLRRQADFENYRKRIEKERAEDSKRATARLVEALIPIVDGFEHALAAHREPAYDNYRKGFELIYKQLLDNLSKLGVERIEPLGQRFDPHLHQAMDRTETSEAEDGTILQVYQPGYVFHGRVLRPAMVRVAVHATPASKSSVH